MVFNVKNLLNDGVDLTLWQRAERSAPSEMSSRNCGFRPAITGSAGEQINADVYQDFLRQHLVPWAKRTYPDGKYEYIFRQIKR
jgi:hypothetical protein